MKKRLSFIFIVLFLLNYLSYSITVVFPFKVSLKEDKSLQWLGKAVSLYIDCGFKLNGINSFSNADTDSFLKKYRITFPYNISKALLIHISKEIGADRLIWGEISSSDNLKNQSPRHIIIKTFVIDIKNFTQKYLPVIKGIPGNIFEMEQKLFNYVFNLYSPGKDQIIFPDIEFDKSGYEIFVKAMLIDNFEERIKLFKKIPVDKDHTSDLLNLELAKSLFFTNSSSEAEEYLKKIEDDSYLKGEKCFLLGIINYFDGQMDESMNNFSKVLGTKVFTAEALSNYGMLLGLTHDYKEGIKYLKRSLKIKKTDEAYLNIMYIYMLDKRLSEAKSALVSALTKFPYSDDLRNILKKFLDEFPLSKRASEVFSKYIPGFNIGNKKYRIHFKLINPFIPGINDESSTGNIGSEYNGANDNPDPMINELDRKLWKNPFSGDSYFKISRLLKKGKKFYSALDYASCALFLSQNTDNYQNVLELLKKLKLEKEFKLISNEAVKKFPYGTL